VTVFLFGQAHLDNYREPVGPSWLLLAKSYVAIQLQRRFSIGRIRYIAPHVER
jgi:hypothetical protein